MSAESSRLILIPSDATQRAKLKRPFCCGTWDFCGQSPRLDYYDLIYSAIRWGSMKSRGK